MGCYLSLRRTNEWESVDFVIRANFHVARSSSVTRELGVYENIKQTVLCSNNGLNY